MALNPVLRKDRGDKSGNICREHEAIKQYVLLENLTSSLFWEICAAKRLHTRPRRGNFRTPLFGSALTYLRIIFLAGFAFYSALSNGVSRLGVYAAALWNSRSFQCWIVISLNKAATAVCWHCFGRILRVFEVVREFVINVLF